MMRYKLTLTYDGTLYFGWQRTPIGPTIQETLEKAIEQITREKTLPEAASRTDRGVHAEGQITSFCLKREWEKNQLQRALNATLPPSIRVQKIEQVSLDFHPTLHALEKEYHYQLCLGPVQNPIYRLYSWACSLSLDLERMERAASDLLGTNDFSSFANEPTAGKKTSILQDGNYSCTLRQIEILPIAENRLKIKIIGNRFLYKMVRNIVGTLVYIGRGKLPE